MTESSAKKRFEGSSPRKMRLVVDLIRDKKLSDAISILKFTKKSAALVVEKTVKSAYSNLVNKLDTGRLDQEEVRIKSAFVDCGPVLKRMLPAPQGRAFRIRKRSSHLTIIVEYDETKNQQSIKK